MRTPDELVYGETNRYPLFVNSAVRCIRYWLNLTRMDGSRLPCKSYRMLRGLDARGKRNWVSNVRCELNQFGFGYVWLNQGVEGINQFLHVLRERLTVCRWQEWNSHVQSSDRFSVYRTFCTVHDMKMYLKLNIDRHLKVLMTRLNCVFQILLYIITDIKGTLIMICFVHYAEKHEKMSYILSYVALC